MSTHSVMWKSGEESKMKSVKNMQHEKKKENKAFKVYQISK